MNINIELKLIFKEWKQYGVADEYTSWCAPAAS